MKEPVHILSVGAFGRTVARRLRAVRPDVLETVVDYGAAAARPEEWPDARVNMIATWRPSVDFCELLDQICYESQRPFIPLVLNSTVLCLGPVVVPGQGSCWGCWSRRLRQHTSGLSQMVTVWHYYATHPEAGPEGYLEPFAAIGAARLSETVEELDSSAEVGGHVWQVDLMTREITTSTVVGVHGCPRCGLHRPPETRTFAEMQRALAYLWQDDDEKYG